ncbi:MAG: DoxX family protein [Planctomycetota bacterium]|nr:MAG: DoxX family protein [Planctomycetota bacterium]
MLPDPIAKSPLIQDILLLLGRIAIAAIFLGSAMNKISNFAGTTAYMEANGMGATTFLLSGAIAFLVLGGLFVLAGIAARYGAALLLLFLIPTTLIFHPPGDPDEQIAMMKNLAIMGGLLMLLAQGSGRFSLERLLPCHRCSPQQ